MIRSFYRWKSFWIGLFVLVFLGWAWSESYLKFPTISQARSGKAIEFSRMRGVTYMVTGPSGSLRILAGGWVVGNKRFLQPTDWENLWALGHAHGVRVFRVPDSLIFFSYLGLWGGGLAWRWRRLKWLETK